MARGWTHAWAACARVAALVPVGGCVRPVWPAGVWPAGSLPAARSSLEASGPSLAHTQVSVD